MENMMRKVERMARGNAKRRLWQRVVAVPAAIVVFVTTYALILPAIAMERDTYCGLEAHQHTDECYTAQLACGYEEGQVLQSAQAVIGLACTAAAHQHTADCYDEAGSVICGYADFLAHMHTADCYDESGALVCPLPQVEPHTHDENCYVEELVNVCGLPESEGHTHSDACYATELVTELTCTEPESMGHTHTDACWANVETMELTCGQSESEGHTHSDACFITEKRLVCSKPEVILHTHTDDCYTTTVLEDGTEITERTCGMTEVNEHIHTADCFYTYEQTIERPHQHTDLCYLMTLTCTKPEHEHSEACYVAPETAETEAAETETAADEAVADETEIAEIDDGIVQIEDDLVQIAEDGVPHFAMPVLVCGMSEHEHSTNCMDENMNYVCGVAPHTHTGECYAIPGLDGVSPILVCGMSEHFHTEACYNEAGELACGEQEHLHDVACFQLPEGVEDPDEAQVQAASLRQKTFENDDVVVTASYGPEAGLPEDARLIAYKVTAESDPERYAERLAQASAKLDESELTAGQMVVYNIGFFDEHNCEIEPLTEVQVEVQFKDSDGFAVDNTAAVLHFDGESVEMLDADSDVENNSATFSGNF